MDDASLRSFKQCFTPFMIEKIVSPRLRLKRFPPQAEIELGTAQPADQHLTVTCRGANVYPEPVNSSNDHNESEQRQIDHKCRMRG